MQTTLTSSEAFDRYEMVRARFPHLPQSTDTLRMEAVPRVANLGDVASDYDAFVFDAFGVLNVGEAPIAGAIDRIDALRAEGKTLFVLTNAASYSFPQVIEKFQRLGFAFEDRELISSRAVCEAHLNAWGSDMQWGVIAPADFAAAELTVQATMVADDKDVYDQADGYIFLSTECWTKRRQDLLVDSLQQVKRPVIVANPDLVAPREIGLTVEPGYFAHDLMDRVDGLDVHFHGKPFPSVYDHIEALLGPSVPANRIAMVGDSLHTDIWGAMVRGWGSVLVSDHGFLKGQEPMDAIKASGLYPSWIVPQI